MDRRDEIWRESALSFVQLLKCSRSGSWANCQLLGFPVAFKKASMPIGRRAPDSGEDSEEVLTWAVFSPDETRSLRE